MKESLELKAIFPVKQDILFNAWLDSAEHTNMTGGEAECSSIVGEQYTTWDGYITGENLKIVSNIKIVQSWRTSEFETKDEDSNLELHFREVEEGTELTLIHTNIPEGQTQYVSGWEESYFTPMRDYFK